MRVVVLLFTALLIAGPLSPHNAQRAHAAGITTETRPETPSTAPAPSDPDGTSSTEAPSSNEAPSDPDGTSSTDGTSNTDSTSSTEAPSSPVSTRHTLAKTSTTSTTSTTLPSATRPARATHHADTSLGVLVLVNKDFSLPKDYRPADLVAMPATYSTGELMQLRREAKEAFVAMCDSARADGLWLHNRSAWRSEGIQKMLWNRNVEKNGESHAEYYSARPRHSEHQTGLAVDINLVEQRFEDTPQFAWLQTHAHLYGFILRYPKGKEAITGYAYEPWHYRYVGVEVALFIHKYQLTFEEYHQKYIL